MDELKVNEEKKLDERSFEDFLKKNAFLLEIIGIFAAISVLFSSDIVNNNNSYLYVVSFASLLVILLLSSIIIVNLYKSIPELDFDGNEEIKTQYRHFKDSFKIVPFMIFSIALFFIDTGILIYILSSPPMNNLFVIIVSMIFIGIYMIAVIFLPIHESLRKNSQKVKIIASFIYVGLICLILYSLKNNINEYSISSAIIIILISLFGLYDTWKISKSVVSLNT
jgi:FtsH-binding integral membrane protein